MKKILSALFLIALAFGLGGCGPYGSYYPTSTTVTIGNVSTGQIFSSVTDAYTGAKFRITTGTGSDEAAKTITSFNAATQTLTFSAADGNDVDVAKAIAAGMNVAVVFGLKKTEAMPADYNGRPVFNGDESDLRFLDPKGVVVGLYAKGKAKKDTSGFVKYPTFMLKAA